MKIWLDDIRPAPEGYVWCKSVNIAKRTIESAEEPILLIDCDHDLGDYEYSCAVTPQIRQTGNRLSGNAGTAYASLLA